MKSSDLISIETFRSRAEAEIAKGILDQAGIDSMIKTDDAGGMYPALSGAELLVRSDAVDEAKAALKHRG